MTRVLDILGQGAVTSVGLDAAHSCAAIRAGLRRFTAIETQLLSYEEPQVGARVSADAALRSDPRRWLLNLAARALLEVDAGPEVPLLWLVPEDSRRHPLSAGHSDADLLAEFAAVLGRPLAEGSAVLRGGAAALVEGLARAREWIAAGQVARCVVGGADSRLRPDELAELRRDARLLGPGLSQGLVPAEGAAFIMVGAGPERAAERSTEASGDTSDPRCRILGLGLGHERNTVLSDQPSVGAGFVNAFETARQNAQIDEAELDFVCGNYNAERYDAWEWSHVHARCYRTRRERLPTLWPATSVGDMGVAAAAMAVIAAARAIDGGYAEGTRASVQLRSDGELRGVIVLGPTPAGEPGTGQAAAG